LYWQMLGLPGLYNSRSILDEVSRNIGFFSAATCEIPETGLDLRVNLLADRQMDIQRQANA